MIITIFIISCISLLGSVISTFDSNEKSNLATDSAIFVLSGWLINDVLGITLCCVCSVMLLLAILKK